MEECGPPVVTEIAELLDQCTAEELSNILLTIEGGAPVESLISASPLVPTKEAEQPAEMAAPPETQPAEAAPAASLPLAPVPPAGPPPGNGGRRPNPRGSRTTSEEAVQRTVPLSMEELKRILEEHTTGVVMAEVRKVLAQAQLGIVAGGPVSSTDGAGESVDVAMLSQALVERDQEVKGLEERLATLQAELAVKDQRVGELGVELESIVREVRHRQLDLEFQQLKLEERVRSNAELEQSQRSLSVRVEEAGLHARHAALDLDLSRGMTTPRAIRAQGSLPWTLRKNRPVGPMSARGELQ